MDRLGAVLLDLEVELRREAHRPQHAHRVFEVTLLGRADQAHQAVADVAHAAGVVEDAFVGDVEVQRVDGEVAALGVIFQGAVDVVAEDASGLVARRLAAVAVLVVLRMVGAEGGDLDDLAAEMHMHQLEAAADHPRIAEFGADLLGRGAGGHVEILRRDAEQRVAHAAADDVGQVAGLLQALHHVHRVAAELLAPQRMLVIAEDFRGSADGALAAQRGTDGLDQLFQHGCTNRKLVGLGCTLAAPWRS
ncbi:hypothetical protein D9M71_221500 [compost metagenome]